MTSSFDKQIITHGDLEISIIKNIYLMSDNKTDTKSISLLTIYHSSNRDNHRNEYTIGQNISLLR